MEAASDAELVAEARAGPSSDAFSEIVRRHKDKVFRLAVSLLGPGCEGEAEDVTQETFLRAWRHLDGFRGDSAFGTWLYRIAFNLSMTARQRTRFRAPHFPPEALDLHAAPVDAAEEQEKQILAACMAGLPTLYQAVLRQYYWLGMTVDEIAEALGAPEGTVKSYLFRARQMLAERLRKRGVRNA